MPRDTLITQCLKQEMYGDDVSQCPIQLGTAYRSAHTVGDDVSQCPATMGRMLLHKLGMVNHSAQLVMKAHYLNGLMCEPVNLSYV